jgi:hypothetical protein
MKPVLPLKASSVGETAAKDDARAQGGSPHATAGVPT